MVLDYRLGKINSLLSQRHQYRLWITARKLSVISAANSASVKIFASSYSFNVHLSYMKQNRSLFDEEKKKKKEQKGILGKDTAYHKIISIHTSVNNGLLPKSWGAFFCGVVLLFVFFSPEERYTHTLIHPHTYPHPTHFSLFRL